ncbi:phage tail baseplate protein [Sphingomonas gellani]|uniref:GTA baseplate fiber-binding domain-containing protein n=1 Tax=Sphingomonas gellani TaxID=1166340 RepID=UPI001479F5C0|nr:phage tail protein [Sphingomonas gellani]
MPGLSAASSSMAAVLDTLAMLGGGWWASEGGAVLLRDGVDDEAVIVRDAGVAVEGRGVRTSRSMSPGQTVPRVFAVSHYDPKRDHQMGVQRARRPGAGTREERIELPAAMLPEDAKAHAERMLRRAEAERVRRVVALGLEGLAIGPGRVVGVEGETGRWRVVSASAEGMATRLTLTPIVESGGSASRADGGQAVIAADVQAGRTLIAAFEMPTLDDVPAVAPRLAVVAAGTEPGWRRAALLLSFDGGGSWRESGATAATGVIGRVAEPSGGGTALMIDEDGSLIVKLANGDMMLVDADDGQLDGGRNLALVGDELVQFARAEPLGSSRWRLSRLLRGKGGTEAAVGTQRAGDRFVLIEEASVRLLDLPLSTMGTSVRVMASGVGDDAGGSIAETVIVGTSVVPPAPVRLTAELDEPGTLSIRWIRRSRAGWRWIDGTDVPLAEEGERYRVSLRWEGGNAEVETAAPELHVPGSEGPFPGLSVEVRQRGTFGESPPARTILTGVDR